MTENLDGMSSEQLMLRDLIYEVPDLFAEADGQTRDYQFGVASVLKLFESKLQAFDIDQTRFARQMPDVDAWLHGRNR